MIHTKYAAYAEKERVKMETYEFPFNYHVPFPNRHTSRLVSIYGFLPGSEEISYGQFDKLLWHLLELARNNRGSPITLCIDSAGGDTRTLELLLDHIHLLPCPVRMVARNTYSAAGLLLVAGAERERYVFPHSQIMLHQAGPDEEDKCPGHGLWKFKKYHRPEPLDPALQKKTDELNHRLAQLLLEHTHGKILDILGDWSKVSDEEERVQGVLTLLNKDVWLNAEEALKYGIADHIIGEHEFQDLFFH